VTVWKRMEVTVFVWKALVTVKKMDRLITPYESNFKKAGI
jgi:hypothetical protein